MARPPRDRRADQTQRRIRAVLGWVITILPEMEIPGPEYLFREKSWHIWQVSRIIAWVVPLEHP
jgi:hypothetical protein